MGWFHYGFELRSNEPTSQSRDVGARCVASSSAAGCADEKQVPPLRCAPVGMTGWWKVLLRQLEHDCAVAGDGEDVGVFEGAEVFACP
jgi:hypothetical protein